MFDVKWTGSFPSLCYGEWVIKKNGINVSDKIPEELHNSPMKTFGTYDSWHFEDWNEVWESYDDGLKCEDWIANNGWISDLCDTHEEMVDLYYAIQAEDWRPGSCGGCI